MLKFRSIFDLLNSNLSEQDFINYLEEVIWNGEPVSPHDSTSKVYKCANNWYKCKNTGKRFNIKTGSIFERSKISLKQWFYSLHMLFNHKKGISSHQLARDIKVNQRTAWFILHRLREATDNPLFKVILKGFAEIDETFIGGKNKNRHWNKKVSHSQGRSYKDKTPVLGIIERGSGNLIAQVVPNTRQKTLEPIIKTNVEKGATIYTDEHYGYDGLYKNFQHYWVNHRKKQYVSGNTSVNTIESVWAPYKRSIYGIYHWVSKKHLPKYVQEFVLRHNTRKYSDEERFRLVLASTMGKRLTYESLIREQ